MLDDKWEVGPKYVMKALKIYFIIFPGLPEIEVKSRALLIKVLRAGMHSEYIVLIFIYL
jgi:hypothetical protein